MIKIENWEKQLLISTIKKKLIRSKKLKLKSVITPDLNPSERNK